MSCCESYLPNGSLLHLRNYLDSDYHEKMTSDIRYGMSQPQKLIPSKYFYDSKGSELFDRICHTSEYYLTSTELSILESRAGDIVAFFRDGKGDLVELGSGSPLKIEKLLEAADGVIANMRYIPMDICEECLRSCLNELALTHPSLETLALLADFTRHTHALPKGKKLIIFFGSTIGNFTEEECHGFLLRMRRSMDPGDRLVVGMDMLKPVSVMEAAYNDSEGLTRQFNLNVLTHINRRLNADFQLEDFEHLAFFNAEKERIEMHLRARRPCSVQIADLEMAVRFKKGETIRTELSRKFGRERVEQMVGRAGLTVHAWHSDPKGWFSLVELKTASH